MSKRAFESSRDSARRQFFRIYVNRARHDSREWLLSEAEFYELIEEDCAYCGSPPSQIRRMSTGTCVTNGVDRVDSTLGYTADNCVSCCWMCNRAKLDDDIEEFRSWIMRVFHHQFNETPAFSSFA
jgi:hypothetical protein